MSKTFQDNKIKKIFVLQRFIKNELSIHIKLKFNISFEHSLKIYTKTTYSLFN